MPKSKKNLDLNIKREVTDSIRHNLLSMLDKRVQEDPGRSFECAYLREVFLSKYVDENTDSPDVRRHRAIVKWLGVEQLNRRTNERLFETDPHFAGLGQGHEILRKAAKLIRKVLGHCPGAPLLLQGGFSGGATSSVKRGVGTLPQKFLGNRDVTPEAWAILKDVLPEFSTWALYNEEVLKPRLVKGNVLFTVPKTALIDRVACKEPDFNIFAQKAVGSYIRKRLKQRAGIDLNDQSVNRELARQASIDGKLATIDLSSASDSLTTGLVSLLLPYEWFKLLDALRCHKTFIDGASHKNEMFSSMGNGFTFELESLIFWALAHTVRGTTRSFGKVSVYGDDIVVPASCAGVLIQFLFWVGFRTNASKTFYKGRFRESCGGHFHSGRDVTPFYLRRPIKDVSDLILFLNQFRKWLIQTGMDTDGCDFGSRNDFVSYWYSLAALIPRALWGGYDLSSRVQLASPGKQKCELLRTNKRWRRVEEALSVGMYLSRLHLLDRTVSSSEEMNSFSELVTPTDQYTIRRCKVEWSVFGLVKPTFTCEQWWYHGTPDVSSGPPCEGWGNT